MTDWLLKVLAGSMAVGGIPLVIVGLLVPAPWLPPAGVAASAIGIALLVLRHGPLVENDIRTSGDEKPAAEERGPRDA